MSNTDHNREPVGPLWQAAGRRNYTQAWRPFTNVDIRTNGRIRRCIKPEVYY
ncbi:MAG: hypothetical protein ACHQ6U_04235 [Thermodesulfobacteriota bacterium]